MTISTIVTDEGVRCANDENRDPSSTKELDRNDDEVSFQNDMVVIRRQKAFHDILLSKYLNKGSFF